MGHVGALAQRDESRGQAKWLRILIAVKVLRVSQESGRQLQKAGAFWQSGIFRLDERTGAT